MVLVSYKQSISIELYKLLIQILSLQSDDSSMLVGMTSFPCEESRMTTRSLAPRYSIVDEQMRAMPKHPEPISGLVVVTLSCCMRSKAGATVPSSVADARLSTIVSPTPRAHPPFRLFRLSGRRVFWPPRPCSASSTRMGLSSFTPSAKAAAHSRSAARALQSPLDCRGQTLSAVEPVWPRGGGACHGQCCR
jgi:hypothetical protein